jgi:hypothetical protein
MMLRGVFWSLLEPFPSRRGRFAALSLSSDVALGGFSPAAEIAYEVDGGDDGALRLPR